MNCHAIELLILESEGRTLDEAERRKLDDHLRSCPACRAFQAGRLAIRRGIREISGGELPPGLSAETRRLCLEALEGRTSGAAATRGRGRVPALIVVVSVLFTVLAALWLATALADVSPGRSLPPEAWAAIAFVVQNVLMLFLSPLIFRAERPAENEAPSFR
jgi:anti-sigma factor RsiW